MNLTDYNNAFNDLFSHLLLFTEKIIQNEAEAEDIAIVCFVKLWEIRDKINSIESARSYLFKTAHDRCIDYLRKTKSRKNYIRHVLRAPAEEERSFDDLMKEALLIEAIYNEIEKLPPGCRRIFKMVYVERMSRIEISSRLNMNIKTVNSHCRHGVKLLRKLFLIKTQHQQ